MSQTNEPTNCANCGAYIPKVTVRSASSTAFCCSDCKKAYYNNRPIRSCLNKGMMGFTVIGLAVALILNYQDKESETSVETVADGVPGEQSASAVDPALEKPPTSSLLGPVTEKWTNREGKVISATLLRVENGNAVLLKDGSEFPYPITNLSEEDQRRVRAFEEASK